MKPINSSLVEELKKILSDEFKIDLSSKEAHMIAHCLVGTFDTLAKIYHEDSELHDNSP